MIGLTMGTAAAANYPAPFVVGGSADVAVVYGTGSGVSVLDAIEAGNLQSNLQSFMGGSTSGTSTSTSGETVSLDTSGTRIWLNTSLNKAKSILTKTNLPNVLGDSTFQGNVEAKVTSNIKFYSGIVGGSTNSGKVIFAKQPKSNEDPVMGITLGTNSANPLYNATASFKAVNFSHSDSEGESITLFGKDFVISTATSTTDLVLFSSAEEVTLTKTSSDNPTATVSISGTDYTIELLNGDSTTATVAVDGTSKSITEGNSKKVGGIEVAVKTVTSSDVAGITATLLVGSEKLTFVEGSTVTKGSDDEPVDGTYVYLVGGTGALTELAVSVFKPDSSNDAILPGTAFVDPVFESFKFDFVGLSSPLDDTNREIITVQNSADDSMSITMTDQDGNAGTFLFARNQSNQWFLGDDSNNTISVREMANVTVSDYIVLGNEEYGHLLQVTTIKNNTGTDYTKDQVKLTDVLSGTVYSTTFTAEQAGTISIDGRSYTVTFYDTGDSGYAYFKYPTGDSANANTFVMYPTIQTEKGAQIVLYEPLTLDLGSGDRGGNDMTTMNFPDGDGYTAATWTYAGNDTQGNWTMAGAGTSTLVTGSDAGAGNADSANATIGQLTYSFYVSTTMNSTKVYLVDPETTAVIDQPAIIMFEAQDDGNRYEVVVVDLENAAALMGTSDNGVGVNNVLFSTGVGLYKDIALASDSKITKDVDWFGTLVTTDATDSDQKTVTISYPQNQVFAQIYIGEVGSAVSSSTSTSSSTQLGDVLVKDNEISSVSSKNLIVVGGSCINSVAANVLGAGCGAGFTEATGVGSGEFLIESIADKYTTGKIALVVAGYEVADTVNAAKYLRTQTVDTASGMKYKGTTSTSAELVVA